MSPAFSHCFLKRLSAFSKLSSGSTITFVTDTHPFPVHTMDSDLYHAPQHPAIACPKSYSESWVPGGTGACRQRGGRGRAVRAVVRSTSSPREPPRSGASACPPSPETGVARRPCSAGTTRAAEAPCSSGRATARRIRSRRLPAARHPPALPSRCVHDLATWQLASSFGGTSPRGGGWGREHPPWTRIFCALPKRRTRFSWPVSSGLCVLRVNEVRADPVV